MLLNGTALNTLAVNSDYNINVSTDPTQLGPITFGNLNLCGFGGSFYVQSGTFDDLGTLDLQTYDYAQQDGGGVVGYYARRKDIKVKCIIKTTDVTSLNDLIDLMKQHFYKKTEQTLKIKINGVFRECVAWVTNLKFNRDYENSYILGDIDVTFTTMSPHWSELTAANYTLSAITALSTSDDIVYSAITPTDYSLYLVVTSATSITDADLTINGYPISITTGIATGDVIIFNGMDKTVTKNGTEIDYTGTFTQLQVGDNPFTLEFTGSAIDVDATFLWYNTYA